MHTIEKFVRELASAPSGQTLVNHYASDDPRLDRPRGASIRRRNLNRYLCKFLARPPRLIVVGEAAGYRGNRFTGIPFTSEYTLLHHSFFQNGVFERSSCRAQPWREASGSIVWETFDKCSAPFMLWGIVPFHPHRPAHPLSNRAPTRKEQDEGLTFFRQFRAIFPSVPLVAAGRIAERMLTAGGFEHHAVRHPSHGGKAEFQKGILALE